MDNKVNNICRLCLAEESHLESIFQCGDSQSQGDYSVTIKEYMGFEVRKDDSLPACICTRCSEELLNVVAFITRCRAANEKLQNALLPCTQTLYHCYVKKEEELTPPHVKEEHLEELDDVYNDEDDDEDYLPDELEPLTIMKKKEVKLEPPPDVQVEFVKEKRRGKFRKHSLVGGRKVGDKIKCETCGLLVNSVSSMAAHYRTHTGERPFKCSECGKGFGLKGTMIEHFNRLHRKTEYLATSSCVCDICGKKCYKKTDLKVHMRTHTQEKPYTCKYCSRSFTQTASLNEHVRVHIGEKSFSCHICGKSFLRKTSLRRHMQVHSEDKKYNCHLCHKPVKTSQALKIHMGLHTSEKTHICEVCGVSFAQKGNLKSHIISKHSEKSGECEICKKSVSNLKEHAKKHSGERPFPCNLCSKRFIGDRSLRLHMKWHTETDKYPCTYKGCSSTFPTNRQLKYHNLKVHEKYAPFVCKLCSKAYYRESDLKQHKLSSCKGGTDNNEIKNILILSGNCSDD